MTFFSNIYTLAFGIILRCEVRVIVMRVQEKNKMVPTAVTSWSHIAMYMDRRRHCVSSGSRQFRGERFDYADFVQK